MSSDVRVRRLGREESLLAAALHVQSMRAGGGSPATGHLDRFAQAWATAYHSLPTWVAEADQAHVGVLVLQLPAPLPPGLGEGAGWPRVLLLYVVRPETTQEATGAEVTGALLARAQDLAREHGLPGLELGRGVTVPPRVLDGLGALVRPERRVQLPASLPD